MSKVAMLLWPLRPIRLVQAVDRICSYTFLHCSNEVDGGGGSRSSAEAELMRSKAILNAGSFSFLTRREDEIAEGFDGSCQWDRVKSVGQTRIWYEDFNNPLVLSTWTKFTISVNLLFVVVNGLGKGKIIFSLLD
jgi:hypothetical protein